MHCETCGVDCAVEVRADQVVCTVCASVLRSAHGAGLVVQRTFTRERPGRAPRSAVRRALQRTSIASEAHRAAAERAAQSAVDAVSAAGYARGSHAHKSICTNCSCSVHRRRMEPGAARAVADRAVRDAMSLKVAVALPEGPAAVEACLRAAEAHLLQSGARSAGKTADAADLLRKARECRGACVATAAITEDIWALAAVAIVSAGERPSDAGGDDALCRSALAMASRFKLLPKRVCSAAIVDLWRYAF